MQSFTMRFTSSWVGGALALIVVGMAPGQEVTAPPAPLTAPRMERETTPGEWMAQRLAAKRALELGFPSIAIAFYRHQLSTLPADISVQDRGALQIELATALLDEGRPGEADEVLRAYVGVPVSSFRLRQAMVAMQLRRLPKVKEELAAIRLDELDRRDRAWFFFVQGQLADVSNEPAKARGWYSQAAEAAVSDLHRAHFVIAREELRLLAGEFSEAHLAPWRKLLDSNTRSPAANSAVELVAIELNGLGRKSEAIEFLRQQINGLSADYRTLSDQWHLLLGFIAGANDQVGRSALIRVLSQGSDREKQRVALLLLRRGAPRAVVAAELDRLIAQTPAHPILEELYLFRAEDKLEAKAYVEAEADAQRMLEAFPGSRLKPHALGICARAAWERAMYLTAADFATKARDALPEAQGGEARADLGLLIAEAYFRANKFRSAAEAYAATLTAVPMGVSSDLPGKLIFQRVYAEIEAGKQEADLPEGKNWWVRTAALLDQLATDRRFDAVNRWQAEWNFARALQVAGPEATKLAFSRVERLMTEKPSADTPAISDELRMRMVWLQARLSLGVVSPERTLEIVDQLLRSLDRVDSTLRNEIAGSAGLLKAEAIFKLNRDAEGLAALAKVRADFPNSDAAVKSFIVEADRASERGSLVDAQKILVNLADKFPQHPYAPMALFGAALNAELRGLEVAYSEGNSLMDRLCRDYPKSDLVFDARMKQGDFLRLLYRFNFAQRAYEEVLNGFPQHKHVLYAQLALAATHNAQASAEPATNGQLSSHAEQAISIYERLVDRPDAPVELRLEAGYNLGLLLSRRPQPESRSRAQQLWWDQINRFIPFDAPTPDLGTKGSYWAVRTLLALGELLESEGKLDQARQAYDYILKKNLPWSDIARAKSNVFGITNLKL